MTKIDALTIALNNLPADQTGAHDTITNMIEVLRRNADKERKPSKKEVERRAAVAEFRAKVYSENFENNPDYSYTCKELAEKYEVHTSKISAALTALAKEGKINRVESATKNIYWEKVKGE